jgi:hypothetical protein
MLTSKEYLNRISDQLKTYNRKAVEVICSDLIKHLYESEENFEVKDVGRIMQQLRNKRMFSLMQKVGDALIQTGRHTYKIRRLYAQALIDQNNLTAAIAVLKELVTDTSNAPGDDADAKLENTEARGLSGRVYKQLYVNSKSPNTNHSIGFIKEAIKFYLDVYITEPEIRTWHGINAAALLKRADADNIQLSGFPSAHKLAGSILQSIQNRYDDKAKVDAWDFATAAEACVVLNKPDEALEWMSGYARMPDCDAFELASTLRQLEEVWRLNMNSETGRLLMPLLRAELLKREGGNIIINVDEIKQQNAVANIIDEKYNVIIKPVNDKSEIKLEKVFGADSFKTYKWYMTGVDRCQAVARIGTDSSKGFGTGFLLKGSALHESLGEEPILITNAHVVSNDLTDKALNSEAAIIIFEALNRDEEFRISEIIWSSPKTYLDATIIRFKKEDQERLKELTKNIKIYPVTEYLPAPDPDDAQRIYIIGHPFGGTLQLSFQDNILLDHEDPKIHYRTPTAGGSSGSPVFNQQWDLIGLHHAGSAEMPCLNNKPGVYEANEGIWIQAIKEALRKFI